jgi:hypothetical protein
MTQKDNDLSVIDKLELIIQPNDYILISVHSCSSVDGRANFKVLFKPGRMPDEIEKAKNSLHRNYKRQNLNANLK